MRAHEFLQEEDVLPPKAMQQFQAWGFRPAGSGAFKQVFTDRTGHVLIVQLVDALGQEETFLDWVKFCQRHPNHPYLPNFGGIRSVTIDGEEYVVTRAERLREINKSERTIPLEEILENLISVATEGRPYERVRDDLEAELWGSGRPEKYQQAVLAMFDKLDFRGLFDTIRMVYRAGERLGWDDDLHSGNFMIASNGRIVINDPWV